ncbi:MAG: hypothetical protein RL754_573 [Bacteroidota bacterium]
MIAAQCVAAQGLRFSASVFPYVSSEGKAYVDVYTKLDASTVGAEMLPDSTWKVSTAVAIEAFGKMDVVRFEYVQNDSASGAPILLQKSVFAYEQKDFTSLELKITVNDIVADQVWTLSDSLALPHGAFRMSPVVVVDNAVELAPDIYHKGGEAIVPISVIGMPVLENSKHIKVYTEGYSEQDPYLLQYRFTDGQGVVVPGTVGFKRCEAGTTPLMVVLPTAELGSGMYTFEAWQLSVSGDRVNAQSTSVLLFNGAADSAAFAGDYQEVISRDQFETNWSSWHQVHETLSMIAPVANIAERRVLMNLKESEDTARVAHFLVGFWEDRAPGMALETWIAYKGVVDKVNAEFGSKTLAGYKTQMGRVFLQYGAPSLVEERPFDGKNYPYQIWQYDELKSPSSPLQQNQVFIFVDQELVGRQYTLIHSSAIGEVKDHKWQYHLSRHTNGGPDIDATSTQYGRDNFGERISNSIITTGQGTWFDQFNN